MNRTRQKALDGVRTALLGKNTPVAVPCVHAYMHAHVSGMHGCLKCRFDAMQCERCMSILKGGMEEEPCIRAQGRDKNGPLPRKPHLSIKPRVTSSCSRKRILMDGRVVGGDGVNGDDGWWH